MNTRPKPFLRPAKIDDWREFTPDVKSSFHAWVVELEGKPVGIGGVYYQGSMLLAFSHSKEELDDYPLMKARGAKKVLEIIGGRMCYALASPRIPDAAKNLERLGFKHLEGRLYQWKP